jgi:hypothetical protein
MVIDIPGGGKLMYLNHCQVGFTMMFRHLSFLDVPYSNHMN